jgi:hypothetical protein
MLEVDLPRTPPYLVWVDSSGSFGIHSSPGILLAWRRTPDSALTTRKESEWECLVISASEPAPTNPTSLWVYQHWMNPAHVRPVDIEKLATVRKRGKR